MDGTDWKILNGLIAKVHTLESQISQHERAIAEIKKAMEGAP